MERRHHQAGFALLIFICTAVSLSSGINGRFVQADSSNPPSIPAGAVYAPDKVIVGLRPAASATAVRALQSEMNAVVLQQAAHLDMEVWQLEDMTVAEAIEIYQTDSRIAFIEPDYLITLNDFTPPSDPLFGLLYGLSNSGQTGGAAGADISAPAAWELTTGDDVIIAVIDTGVDYTHSDLAANMWINHGEIPGNKIDDDGNGFVDDVYGYDFFDDDGDPMDTHGHGTHVAGTIAAVGDNGVGVTGVNWSARIMALRFIGPYGGWTSDAVRALNYAVANGATISNNSWGGGGYSTALRQAIENAGAAGHIFVAAAGNNGRNTDNHPHYPSAYNLDNIVSVAATDHRDRLASFSNYGVVSVDLSAPGVSILSTMPANSYNYLSGTSMAAPHVAGVLGLMHAYQPALSGAELIDALLDNVDPVPALAGKTMTGGRLNAHAALLGISRPPVPQLQTPVNGAVGQRRLPQLAWTPLLRVDGYTLEVALDAGFNQMVYETAVADTAHTLPIPLTSMTQYFWRVTAHNGYGSTPSPVFTFTTHLDVDMDGVNDFVEANAPNNGDGNNDGIPDNQQPHVASLLNKDGSGYVTVAAPYGVTLENVRITDALETAPPPGVSLAQGSLRFNVRDVTPGTAVTVTIILHNADSPASYWKYAPTPNDPTPHWHEFLFDGHTGAVIAGNTITLYLVDGARGDADLTANGVIVDPGAPAWSQWNVLLPLVTQDG